MEKNGKNGQKKYKKYKKITKKYEKTKMLQNKVRIFDYLIN